MLFLRMLPRLDESYSATLARVNTFTLCIASLCVVFKLNPPFPPMLLCISKMIHYTVSK
jgi:hypothetical protein